MNSKFTLKEAWGICRRLIISIEYKDREFSKPKNLEHLISRFDALFTDTILNKVDDNNAKEILNELLRIRNIFHESAFFAGMNTVKLDEKNIDKITKILSSINEKFSTIENIESLINSYLASKAIFQDIENQLRGQAKELFGELTTTSIYKPYQDEYKKFKIGLIIKQSCFFGVLTIMFLLIGKLTGLFNYNLFFIDASHINEQNIHSFISRITILLPLAWFILFLGKRINEDKKLEQTYLHKTVIAKSLANYIDYMDEKLYENESREIVKKLFDISVDSLGLNPALLLEKSTAEKIPMEELISKIIDKTKLNT